MTIPQPLMLTFCALFPAFLIYMRKRHDIAVIWIAVITALDIFNSQLYMNLSAILIFGIVCIPYLWMRRDSLRGNLALKCFGIYFLYLVLLGVYHGFLFPWNDPTGLRSVKDLAQFRTILHLGRTFCEWMALVYLMLQIQDSPQATIQRYLKTIFYCSILLVLGTVVEKVFQVDLYHFFTGGRPLLLLDRPRSLDYEPRGLSQNLAYAILLTPFTQLGFWRYFLIPVFFVFAFFVTVSFTGFLVLGFGIALLTLILALKEREFLKLHLRKMGFAVAGLILLFATVLVALPRQSTAHLNERFSYLFKADFAEKLEVFDAAAINFLNHNPKYYPLGTGPGLIYLPAGDYIIERDRALWGNHFEALPHMGAVLLISNSGILGLGLFLFALFLAIRTKLRKEDLLMFTIGCMLSGIYFLQLRYFFIFGFACLLSQIPTKRELA